eukprot:13271482-Alexandrium_andersonii.AAC.1
MPILLATAMAPIPQHQSPPFAEATARIRGNDNPRCACKCRAGARARMHACTHGARVRARVSHAARCARAPSVRALHACAMVVCAGVCAAGP